MRIRRSVPERGDDWHRFTRAPAGAVHSRGAAPCKTPRDCRTILCHESKLPPGGSGRHARTGLGRRVARPERASLRHQDGHQGRRQDSRACGGAQRPHRRALGCREDPQGPGHDPRCLEEGRSRGRAQRQGPRQDGQGQRREGQDDRDAQVRRAAAEELSASIVRPMRASPGLLLDYVSPAEYQAARWGDVLGVATFNGAADSPSAAAEIPVAQVSTPVLPGTGHVCEVWRCDTPATSGRRERVRFRSTADMLFGCIALTEATECPTPAAGAPLHSALHEATTQAYRQICATLDAQNYPHLLRVWNYLPDINRDSHGSERYC